MRLERGHPAGREQRVWELCFDPSDAFPMRFCSHSPKRWSVMWCAGDPEIKRGLTVPSVIMRVRWDAKGYRAERVELLRFADAKPEATDMVIAVPAGIRSIVFDNGRTRMLGADPKRWPDLVRKHVRFEQ